MRPTQMPHILVLSESGCEDILPVLEGAGFSISRSAYGKVDQAELARSQLIILDVTARTATSAQALCRRWRIDFGEHYLPIIWLCFESSPALLAGGLDAGADICLPRPLASEHLLAQAKALLRVQHLNDRLQGRVAETQQINQRLQQAYQQIDNDLEMARRIHRGFMPSTLPEVQQTRFAVCFRPRSRIGGDFYDVMRLDEDHVGLYVADAMGQGLPASSLLSIFVKRSMRTKEIIGRSYRLIPPSEVLTAVNRELIGIGLPETPFVTMLYMQLNCRDGSLSFARASHPLPLYVPASGEPECWASTGTLLGVYEADFPDQTRQLRSGDRVLLMSDGVNASSTTHTPLDLMTAAVNKYRAEPLSSFVDLVSRELLEHSRNMEDFTILGVEYR